jgi:hypothetical protein
MEDNALNDFMTRFGQIEPPKKFKPGQQNISMNNNATSSGKPALLMGVTDTVTAEAADAPRFKMGDTGVADKLGGAAEAGSKGADIAGTAMEMAAPAMGLIDTFSGSGLNTDANSSGPGKSTGHIMKGASEGMQLGQALGPWGMAAGAAIGGAGGALAHSSAQKEYRENQRTDNLTKASEQESQNRDDYRMAKGLASIKESKGLLEKQMNIIS